MHEATDFGNVKPVQVSILAYSSTAISRETMKTLSLVIALLLLASCASPMPKMPRVSSQQEKECVRQCQRDHSLCNSSCEGMAIHVNLTQCMSQCNQKLGECYELCLQEEQE